MSKYYSYRYVCGKEDMRYKNKKGACEKAPVGNTLL